jgi:hypothetical protein
MRPAELCQRVLAATLQIKEAFGAPGDYGYESREGKALAALYDLHNRVGAFALLTKYVEQNPDDTPLQERLADCLAECVDTVLLTVRDMTSDCPVELRLGSFNQAISERAAELLEEAGR